ncbi:MAG: isoleucine--tRNA ligase [Alphaproteobacteria bacterium]|nr:isoleucine--tRNA ligase [Alphaproteobacteria bacterium]
MYTEKQIKDSIFLPKTSFSMRANLSQKEPELIAFWKDIDLYGKISNQTTPSQKKFILHDGPPYANGSIHLGHALNKTLKDVACRFTRLQGYLAPFTPGWDCHGLPIEWSVEKEALKEKKSLSQKEFRTRCRTYAQEWITKQSEDFQRLGICADFANPYTTMNPESEAAIVRLLHRMLMDEVLYQHTKPVHWSITEKTALAEAEIEYQDKKSSAIFIKYPLRNGPGPNDKPVFLALWTTTPWTIPASQAVSYHPDITYACIDMGAYYLWCAKSLWPYLAERINAQNAPISAESKGDIWQAAECLHPWHKDGYTHSVPLLSGDHVTDKQGTGFVHCAPAHGLEDYQLCIQNNIPLVHCVNDYGVFFDSILLVAGMHIFKDEDKIIDLLRPHLLLLEEIKHSYPHSWRSKAPLIMRATPQWFLSLNALRGKTIKALDSINWSPEGGRQRLESMLERRPDWCVSRQRCWGVPLAFFVHKETNLPLRDPVILEKISHRIAREGCDMWFEADEKEFLPEHLHGEYKKVTDIVDVWFESGTTFSYVLQPAGFYPADLYLEGSDQHRGWFQSSLICSVYAQEKPCTRTIFTHGFVVDAQGRKMSKSEGNVLTAHEILKRYGADILRITVMQSDYHNDIKIGHNILQSQQDIYRKIRNTLRFLLGNLHHRTTRYSGKLPVIEQYILHRLYSIHTEILQLLTSYRYHDIFVLIKDFCIQDLSAFYFDIRKDTLYCEARNSSKRLACLSTLETIFEYLVRWLAPILPFTAEDAWQHFDNPTKEQSVHLALFKKPYHTWNNPELAKQFKTILSIRSAVFKKIENMRAEGLLGSNLEAHVHLYGSIAFSEDELCDLFVTSSVRISANSNPQAQQVGTTNTAFVVLKAPDKKCHRCWKQLINISKNLCQRCSNVMEAISHI